MTILEVSGTTGIRDAITPSLEDERAAAASTLLEADAELGIPNSVVLKVKYQETRITDYL